MKPRLIIAREVAKHKYKNADMQKLTGLKGSTISEIFWGRSDMRISRFRKVLEALECKLIVRNKEGKEYEVDEQGSTGHNRDNDTLGY